MIDIPLFDRSQGIIATESATREKLFDEYVTRVFQADDIRLVPTTIRLTPSFASAR